MRKLEEIRKDFFSRSFFCEEKLVKNSEITLELNIFELLKAFKNIIEKSPEAVVEIQREQVPLELMINLIEQKLKTLKRIPLHSFLDQGFNKHEFIVLFIALLELMKNGKVRIRQSGFLKEIYIYPACAA